MRPSFLEGSAQTSASGSESQAPEPVSQVYGILAVAGLHRTYWGKRIIDAESRGSFNAEDEALSFEWTTCACGRQDPRLHDGAGVPRDRELRSLGSRFAGECVENEREPERFIRAARTLIAIEYRAKALIAELAATTAQAPALSSSEPKGGN